MQARMQARDKMPKPAISHPNGAIRGSGLVDRPAQLPHLQLTGTANTSVDATLARANNPSRTTVLLGPDASTRLGLLLMSNVTGG